MSALPTMTPDYASPARIGGLIANCPALVDCLKAVRKIVTKDNRVTISALSEFVKLTIRGGPVVVEIRERRVQVEQCFGFCTVPAQLFYDVLKNADDPQGVVNLELKDDGNGAMSLHVRDYSGHFRLWAYASETIDYQDAQYANAGYDHRREMVKSGAVANDPANRYYARGKYRAPEEQTKFDAKRSAEEQRKISGLLSDLRRLDENREPMRMDNGALTIYTSDSYTVTVTNG